MASTITITILSPPPVASQTGGVTMQITNGSINIAIFENFVPRRLENNQASVSPVNEATAINLSTALNTDYGNVLGFDNASFNNNVVTITLEDGWNTVTANVVTFTTEVTISFNNDTITPPDPLAFTTTITAGTPPCENLNVLINPTGGSGGYDVVLNGNNIPGFTFTAARGSTNVIRLRDIADPSSQVVESLVLPRAHVTQDFNINIFQTDTGATVTIQTIIPVNGITSLEYSLDNVNFVGNGTFSGQPPGDYTVYIRDNFGCVISIDFTISDTSPEQLTPFFIIPEANPIRFYQVQDNSCTIRPNYYNTESCNEAVYGNAYQQITFFEPCDTIPTQFKTNHENLAAVSVAPDGTTSTLAVVRRVQNIGLRDARDAKYFRVDSSNIGIFFDAGNTYDPDTLAVTGTYSQANGLLPDFIVEGVIINVQGLGAKEVISTEFDLTRQIWYARVSGSLSNTNTITAIAQTTYNRQPYDVYEILLPMQTRLNTNFKIRITTALETHQSEEIRVIETVRGTLLRYWNSENKFDIVYALNPVPEFTLRIPEMDIVRVEVDSEIENYLTDDNPVQIDSKLYKNFQLRVINVSSAMAVKIAIALSHDIVFINGLAMTLKEVTEFENIENTNLYNLRFTMIEGGNIAERQRERLINLTTIGAIRLEAELGLINYLA